MPPWLCLVDIMKPLILLPWVWQVNKAYTPKTE